MTLPPKILASLTAPVAALLPSLLMVCCVFLWPEMLAAVPGDDAPQRALFVFLMTLPILYVVLALVSYAIGAVLLRLGARTLRAFLLNAAVLGIAASLPFLNGLTTGNRAAIVAFYVVSALAGAACWFLVARRQQPRVVR